MHMRVYLKCSDCGERSSSDYIAPVVSGVVDGVLIETEVQAADITVDEYFTRYYFWPRCECGSRSYSAAISEDTPSWYRQLNTTTNGGG